jgi:hypothetical protein
MRMPSYSFRSSRSESPATTNPARPSIAAPMYLSSSGSLLTPSIGIAGDKMRQDDDVFEPEVRVKSRPNVPAAFWIGERSQNFLHDGLRHDNFEGAAAQKSIDELSRRPLGAHGCADVDVRVKYGANHSLLGLASGLWRAPSPPFRVGREFRSPARHRRLTHRTRGTENGSPSSSSLTARGNHLPQLL